jgi:hypothetical protein
MASHKGAKTLKARCPSPGICHGAARKIAEFAETRTQTRHRKKEALAGDEEGFALAHRNLGLHGIAWSWFFLFLRKLLHR